ncbi:MAG: nucleoside 2-deoxyribosyltransferase [Flavobacteriaceae bacterium]|nr:nucleoside 2-deoxyribosyltransferase [Flavobacteriaceae bacterium]
MKIIKFTESGNKSKRCFIAMSFSPEATEIRDAIKEVLYKLGFIPILIDEVHYESDITINDALIAEIKKCKFMVADFTEHKYGVYFEAGYALGLKRPVIYTCKKDDFSKTHFDTNHYPHIIYTNADELKEKLKNKIEAWIL